MILVWVTRGTHRWVGFYRMFSALVITDFFGVFFAYPFIISRYISDFTYCFSIWQCNFTSFVLVDAHLAAALLICAMSLDRWLILVIPDRVNHPTSGSKYSKVILIIWLLSSFVAMLPLIGVGSVQMFYPGSWCYFDFLRKDTANLFVSYLFSILTFVVIIVTLIFNIVTICKLYIRPLSRENLHDVAGYDEHYVMIFIVAVTVSFVATCGPFFVNIFLHATGVRESNGPQEMWLERIAVLNAIIDPWLYIVLRKESIERLSTLFRRCRRRTEYESMQ